MLTKGEIISRLRLYNLKEASKDSGIPYSTLRRVASGIAGELALRRVSDWLEGKR